MRRQSKNHCLNIPPLSAQVTAISHDGRGIAHINGKATFIFDALPQEEVLFAYTRKYGKYDEGQAIEIIKPSPQRVKPLCSHFGNCGGCSLQHLQNQAQIETKQAVLLEHLAHIAQTQPQTVLPPLTGSNWGYRHKARLGVKYVSAKQKVLVGFREKNGRYIADLHSCEILHPAVGKKIHQLGQLISSLNSYQFIPQIEVAISDTETALIIRHLQELEQDDLQKIIHFAQQENFIIYLQPGGIDSIHRLWPDNESTALSYRFPDHNIELQFQPSDFTQINPSINRQMINRAIELLQPQTNDCILDLFCGLGNFTLPLARYCAEIIGIEGDQNLVQRAQANAQHNQLDNVKFYCADLSKEFANAGWAQSGFDKILLDPPRTGALEIIPNILALKPKLILYVSCQPSTLARDTHMIIQHRYKLIKAGVMDMFPHTGHVESIALFEKY